MSNRTVHAWLGTFATSGIMLVCNIATGVLAARLLLPEGRGALAAVLFWPQIAADVGLINLNTAVAQQASRHPNKAKAIATTAVYIAIVLAIITVTVAYVAIPYLIGSERSQWTTVTQIYLIAFIPLNFVGAIFVAIRHAEQNFLQFNSIRLIPTLVYFIGMVILWLTNQVAIEIILLCNWLGTASVTLIVMLQMRSLLWRRPSWAEAKSLLSMASRFKLSSIIVMLAREGDRIVITSLLSNTSIGLYAVAFTVATSGLKILTSSFQGILFPKIARQADIEHQRHLFGRGLRYSMMLGVGFSLGFMALIPLCVPFLFGQEFSSAIAPSILLLVAYNPKVLSDIIIHGLYGLDHPRSITISSAIASAAFLGIVIIVLLLPGTSVNLITVIIAFGIANIIQLSYLLYHLNRSIQLNVSDWWGLNLQTMHQVLIVLKATCHDWFKKAAISKPED